MLRQLRILTRENRPRSGALYTIFSPCLASKKTLSPGFQSPFIELLTSSMMKNNSH